MSNPEFVERSSLTNAALNDLFSHAWPSHAPRDFAPILQRSLTYIAAYESDLLIGFVNVAWDGGAHAFLLNPTVHPRMQRRGIGTALVQRAIDAARARSIEWLHVDYEARLAPFYAAFNFQSTMAGVLQLSSTSSHI